MDFGEYAEGVRIDTIMSATGSSIILVLETTLALHKRSSLGNCIYSAFLRVEYLLSPRALAAAFKAIIVIFV